MADLNQNLRVTRQLSIPQSELEWRFSGSGGPGGQHANTANTRVELRFDIAASPSLGPRQRARLLSKLGDEVRVVATDERSQLRNRELALDRLAQRLAEALVVRTPRIATKPGLGAKERRLRQKRVRSDTKSRRRAPGPDD